MALSKSALSELLDALRAGGDLDVIREWLALVLQALIDAEATQHIGARPYERTQLGAPELGQVLVHFGPIVPA
jgi:putative transposase